MTTQKSIPTISAETTLTMVIEALALLGVDIVSPVEQMAREELAERTAAREAEARRAFLDRALGINVASSTRSATTAPEGAAGTTPSIPTFSGTIRSPWVSTTAAPPAPAGGAAPTLTGVSVDATAVGISAPTDRNDVTTAGKGKETSPIAGNCSDTKAADEGTPSGFVCCNCNTYNLLKSAKDSWYAITAGREVGVRQGWHHVQPLVSGVPHASYKKYSSQEAATQAFNEAMEAGLVVVIN
ncbi:hypothetical protein NLJ89_g10365 [Agrocybe chaxingu]|uniref:Ribonuclease H1 N-terminal domain-containing protein n=1 Tax=Agrocybe chaxingu TaxID=84603 RepID=A0A9W8JQR2_9AGAR|nr:hypothetical protein NLJ89_g10365 [Agrocybe chaxingu]